MTLAPTTAPEGHPTSGEHSPSARRLVFALAFAAVTVGACVLLGRRFTHTSWPLERAHMGLVAAAIALYFASYVLRALGWQKLFPVCRPPGSRALPGRLRRRRRQRSCAPVPARLPGEDRHTAQAGRRQARARGDRALDHLARHRRRDRVSPALDHSDRDELRELSPAAPRSRSLRRLLLRPARRRPPAWRAYRSSLAARSWQDSQRAS